MTDPPHAALTASLGVHWIFDAVAAPALLTDEALLRRALAEVPDLLGLTRVSPLQCFAHLDADQPSLAGIVLIAESHFSLHLFPRSGALHGDLFSCRPFAIDAARGHLQALYGVRDLHEQVFERSPIGHARLDPAGARR